MLSHLFVRKWMKDSGIGKMILTTKKERLTKLPTAPQDLVGETLSITLRSLKLRTSRDTILEARKKTLRTMVKTLLLPTIYQKLISQWHLPQVMLIN